MSITLPPFVQLQLPSVPLKGNWRRQPYNPDRTPQGDMFVSVEVDWLTQTNNLTAALINVAGNSPVTLAQIAALVIDNSRCGSDVSFIFPDTGFELTVAARTPGGVYTVLTNALQFYAVAPNAVNTDITIVQICNTVPPVQNMPVSPAQQLGGGIAIPVATGNTTLASGNGTLLGVSLSADLTSGAGANSDSLNIHDGNAVSLWQGVLTSQPSIRSSVVLPFTPMSVRFTNGLVFQQVVAGFTGNSIMLNYYISRP